jgi:GT2 family glycosyltransferase
MPNYSVLGIAMFMIIGSQMISDIFYFYYLYRYLIYNIISRNTNWHTVSQYLIYIHILKCIRSSGVFTGWSGW